jgi:site-specific DNA-cytosine methylase
MQGLRAEGRAAGMIVIENVTGLLTSHGGHDFDAICEALADAGYRFGAVVIDAALFVPQSRERVFIVAVDRMTHVPALLAGGPMAPFHPSALVRACSRQRNPLWFHLPIPPARNAIFADIVEDSPTGVGWHTEVETATLIGMMAPLHRDKLEAAKRASVSRPADPAARPGDVVKANLRALNSSARLVAHAPVDAADHPLAGVRHSPTPRAAGRPRGVVSRADRLWRPTRGPEPRDAARANDGG